MRNLNLYFLLGCSQQFKMSDTSVIVTKEKKSKPASKPKVDKYHGFKVPRKTGGPKSTRWGLHIYELIKEAKPELLERDDVRTAYNNLIACLEKYDGSVITWIPTKSYKYKSGIVLKYDKWSTLMGIPGRFTYEDTHRDHTLQKKMNEESKDIINTYNILFELIKRNVVPYMELKDYELNNKKVISYYQQSMEKLENDIKRYEYSIDVARKQLCEYAKKCVELQQPPTLTSYD